MSNYQVENSVKEDDRKLALLEGKDNTASLKIRQEKADERFAAALSAAIRAGRERPLSLMAMTDDGTTERPTTATAPIDHTILHEGPATPRFQLTEPQQKRADFRDELMDRLAKPPRPPTGTLTVLDLDDTTCHYPIGTGPIFFCGVVIPEKTIYCSRHAAICFDGFSRR